MRTTITTILRNLILIAVYGLALVLIGFLFTEENRLGVGAEYFICLKIAAPLAVWGLVELERLCLRKGLMPEWYREVMASHGYAYDTNRDRYKAQ